MASWVDSQQRRVIAWGSLWTAAELSQRFGLMSLFSLFQHWPVFQEVKDLLTLVPPLVGLKGNLEMTLASRLSTSVSGRWLSRIVCALGTGYSFFWSLGSPHPHGCCSALVSLTGCPGLSSLFFVLFSVFHGYPELVRDQHNALVPSLPLILNAS